MQSVPAPPVPASRTAQSSLSVIPTVNIILVNDFAHINGGASKVALGSARALAVRGHRVVVMAGVGPVDASLTNVENLSVECLGQHDLLGNPNRLSAAVQGIWNWDAAARIKAILSELPFAKIKPSSSIRNA